MLDQLILSCDQQYPMEHAFRGPAKVLERFGSVDPGAIAAADPEEFESRIFQPSSFAIRKAKAEAEARAAVMGGRTLVSLGTTQHWMKDRKGKDIYVPAELFMEHGRPMRRFIRLDGDTEVHSLFDDSQRDPAPEPLGQFSRRSIIPSRFPPSEDADKSWPIE